MLFLNSIFNKNFQAEQATDETDIDESIRYVESLMQWYCAKRSMYLAGIIVSKLEEIKQRSDDCEGAARNMACQRLINQWNYLAHNGQFR